MAALTIAAPDALPGTDEPQPKRSLRFIFLTQYYAPEIGAPQTRLASVVRILRERGHAVSVVTAMPNHLAGKTFDRYRGKVLIRESRDGTPVVRTWIFAATGMGIARLFSYLSFAMSSSLGLFACGRADVLFIESPPLFLALPGIAYARARGMKTVFNVADLWPDSVRELGGAFAGRRSIALAQRLERWTYEAADVVCGVSEGIARTLATSKGVPPEKVLFFPNGVDTTLFSPRPADPALASRFGAPGTRLFLYAGTHGSAQGLENVVAAAALVRDTAAHFLFVGDGHTKARLRAMVRELALTNVDFVDSQPLSEMPRYFSIAYASIVPLLKRDIFKDARPSKMFPSLASAVPVIYSGEGESAALLENSGSGIVATPESPADLARAIRLLLDDPALRDQLGRNGRAFACAAFGWDAIVTTWLQSLRQRLTI